MFRVCVKEPSNHPLVLRIVFPCFAFEEFNTPLAQGDGDFHSLISKDKILRTWKEVRDDLWVSERFVRVSNFLAHKFVFLSSNNQRRRCG